MRACFNVVWTQKLISAKVARFRRINLEQPRVHHDALEFPDGQVVKLAWLCEGQHATVLQLPASPRATKEAEQQRRCTLVNLIGPLAIAHCTTVVVIERTIGGPMALRLPGRGNKIALSKEVRWPYESLRSKGTQLRWPAFKERDRGLGVTAATTRILSRL